MEPSVSTTPTENTAAHVGSGRLAADRLDATTRQVASDCLWVVIVLVAIPWRYVLAQYVVKRGERWRSR